MTGTVEPRPDDDVLAMQPVIRTFNTQKLRALIDTIEPMVDGSYGPINPQLAKVYMQALNELGKLYRVYDRPPVRQEEDEPEAISVDRMRAQVEGQLRELEARHRTPDQAS